MFNILNTSEYKISLISPIANKILGIASLHAPYSVDFTIFSSSRFQYDFKKWISDGRLIVLDVYYSMYEALYKAEDKARDVIFITSPVVLFHFDELNMGKINHKIYSIFPEEIDNSQERKLSVINTNIHDEKIVLAQNHMVFEFPCTSKKEFPHDVLLDYNSMLLFIPKLIQKLGPTLKERNSFTIEYVIDKISKVFLIIRHQITNHFFILGWCLFLFS